MVDRQPYLNPRQSLSRLPTDWEMQFAGAIESAFGKGLYELDALVDALNTSGLQPEGGGRWTAETFTTVIHALGARNA